MIRRSMLLDRLSAAAPSGVTLVCAPAGSGKTMLVRSWIEAAALTDGTGWVSVERNEHDAQRFWLAVTGTKLEQFRSPVLKHHNPKTIRTNVGEDYHGCLKVDVRRSATLYRRIEGWASAAMGGKTLSAA